MLRFILVATASLTLGACGRAGAITPDPANPAHCIAAFNYGAYLLSLPPRQSEGIALRMAQAKFEVGKLKASGSSLVEAKAEGLALTKAYADDGKQLNKLSESCSAAQLKDPDFKKQLPSLLASARAVEPRYYPEKP